VKTVCSFIGAQAPIDVKKSGGRNPLVELAQQIDILRPLDGAESELEALRGPRVADDVADDPRFAQGGAEDAANPPGSFEAFSAAFGNMIPPPGGA
jgi:hypothetical protein